MGSSTRTLPKFIISVELVPGEGLGVPAGRQSDPSKTNSGSLAGKVRASAGVIVHPWSSRWHVPQTRPFVPASRKNGLFESNSPEWVDAVSSNVPSPGSTESLACRAEYWNGLQAAT